MSKYIDEAISFYEDALNTNLTTDLLIKYKVLDDIDFFNECKKETGNTDLSDFLVIAIPKQEDDTRLLLLINDYVETRKDNYGLEILYSQLSTAYINSIEELKVLKKQYNHSFLKNAKRGIEIWEDYYAVYLTQCTMKSKNIDANDDDNPYAERQALKIGLNFLNKAIISRSKTLEQRISIMLYAFSKIAIAKPSDSKKIYNISPFITTEELKKPIQDLYCILASKSFTELTFIHFIKINKLMNKIIDTFIEIERKFNEED